METEKKTKGELIKELQKSLEENRSLKVLKEKREAEFFIANNELARQNKLKEKRAAELIVANQELLFQNDEKEKRAAELVVANKELLFQNDEKEKRAVELIIAKEKAEEYEKKFRQIADNIDEVFWLRTDREMNYISPSFEKIWGIPCQAIYENHQLFTEKIHPEDKPIIQEIFNSSEFQDYGMFNYEYRILRDDNEVRWINVKTFPLLNDSGQIIKRVGIASDTTERYLSIQELILAKEHAEESDRLKSAFLANMSHEIRTPMNGILGFASILKEADLSGEERQDYLELMEQSGARMLNIITEIMDISKIESGQMKVFYRETNINKLIENIFDLIKLDNDAKKIKLSFKRRIPATETIIDTDGEKLYSILTNLVNNAVKFTDEGAIEFGFSNLGSHLEFYVKDTGIGIPTEKQQTIFERFIQVDMNDNKARQGAGLGLSIAKAFVELLKGKIWVESEQGKGSTFYFTLPFGECKLNAV